MKEVNVTELRNNLPAYLGMVKAGEELLLTSRGKKIARLTPVADGRAGAREQLALLTRLSGFDPTNQRFFFAYQVFSRT